VRFELGGSDEEDSDGRRSIPFRGRLSGSLVGDGSVPDIDIGRVGCRDCIRRRVANLLNGEDTAGEVEGQRDEDARGKALDSDGHGVGR
jgi:hypothetical protein